MSALRTAVISLALFLGAAWTAAAADLPAVRNWVILLDFPDGPDAADRYGELIAARRPGLVIVDADHHPSIERFSDGVPVLAYLSVGEADSSRASWPSLKDGSFLVEENPNWKGSYRTDIRDPQWRRFLLEQEMPRLWAMGFDGFMMDTLDTVPYLEKKDPARFAGSRDALISFIREARRRFPNAVFLANGTESLSLAAPLVDGLVTEGLYAAWDFEANRYRETTAEERDWRVRQVEAALQVSRRPVFDIEYAAPQDTALAREAARRSLRAGFKPYVSTKNLDSLR